MSKHIAGLALVLVSAVLGISLGTSQTVPSAQKAKNRFEQGMEQATGKATPIREGVMTGKQKKHSKIFGRFEAYTRGKKLRELVAERGDVYVIVPNGDVQLPASFNLHDFFLNLTCQADAVIIGTVKSKTSQIIEEGTFVFTDYELIVTDVLKNNVAAPIELNGSITYTSPGGAVELNGHVIRAVQRGRRPLQVGEDYLLYLKFIPETGAFKGFSNSRDSDTFQIKDGVITQVSDRPLPLGTKRTTAADAFMAEARAVLNQACKN